MGRVSRVISEGSRPNEKMVGVRHGACSCGGGAVFDVVEADTTPPPASFYARLGLPPKQPSRYRFFRCRNCHRVRLSMRKSNRGTLRAE